MMDGGRMYDWWLLGPGRLKVSAAKFKPYLEQTLPRNEHFLHFGLRLRRKWAKLVGAWGGVVL